MLLLGCRCSSFCRKGRRWARSDVAAHAASMQAIRSKRKGCTTQPVLPANDRDVKLRLGVSRYARYPSIL
jgi:hypothetical protein